MNRLTNDRKIDDLLRERRYDVEIKRFLQRQPEFVTKGVLDDVIRQKTFKSIINKTALFIGVDCGNCGVELVDPTGGILTKNNQRHARCGRCGYTCLVGRHVYRII
jgi:hypothetical protein